MKVAVIGTGISGLLAARLLADHHDVQVFEGASTPGGHALTVDVEVDGSRHPIDVGFMVYNEGTYPNFTKMLAWLGVETRESDMSFSVRCGRTGQEYAGHCLQGLFARPSNLARPSFLRMLADVARFYRDANRSLDADDDGSTLRSFVARNGYGPEFVAHYLVPMTASIWSTPPSQTLDFPARFLLRFFRNHGLLQVLNQPTWRTIVGGSRTYVGALIRPFRDRIRLNCPVQSVLRTGHEVIVRAGDNGPESFDAAVMATHADTTMQILSDLDPLERRVLGAFPYGANEVVVHTDTALLPTRRRAWASWNALVSSDPDAPATLTYNLNRLQGHRCEPPILVSLNPGSKVDRSKVLRTFTLHHPIFDQASIASQSLHEVLNGHRKTYYCGAYWGNGFHEDGVNSALAVARQFGTSLETCIAASSKDRSSITACSRSTTGSDTVFS